MKYESHALTLVAAMALTFVACGDGSLPVSPTSTEASSSTSASPLSATFDWVPVVEPTLSEEGTADVETTYDTFRFTARVTGGVPPYSHYWDFGDGEKGTGNPVKHYYYRPGTYAVTLRVGDSAGGSTGGKSPRKEINVEATPFTLECDANPTQGSAPLKVRFRAWPDGNVGPIDWLWDFGDGATSNSRLADHTYHSGAGLLPSDGSPTCAPTPKPKPSGPVTYLAVVTATEKQGGQRSVSCKQKITLK